MSIKLYLDYLSQPSRAVLSFCKFAKIPHEIVEIRLNRKQNLTPEFLKVNPLHQVPVIDDGGFILTESHAILTYLARKYNAEEPFYPKDLQKRALVDSYLHWHHTNTRNITKLFQLKFKQFTPFEVHHIQEVEEANSKKALKQLDEHWLKDKKFLTDKENMTIADISAACELMQVGMIDYDLSSYKNLTRWLDTMMSYKEMQESHATFLKLSALAKQKSK